MVLNQTQLGLLQEIDSLTLGALAVKGLYVSHTRSVGKGSVWCDLYITRNGEKVHRSSVGIDHRGEYDTAREFARNPDGQPHMTLKKQRDLLVEELSRKEVAA